MPKPIRVLAPAVLLLLNCAAGLALKGDGNFLIESCNAAAVPAGSTGTANMKAGWCLGLLQGVVGLNSMYVSVRDDGFFCTPKGYTNIQGVRVVVSHLNRHPEKLHLDATILTVDAFHEAFPCSAEPER